MYKPQRQSAMILMFLFTLNLGTSSAISLNCEYHLVDFGIGEFYTCTATISKDAFNENLTTIHGNHTTGKDNGSVLGFRIRNQNLKHFVGKVEKFFPNLKGINLDMNSILNVTNAQLIAHKNLEYLSFRDNKITNLDGNLLNDLPNLKQVSFASNNIKHVGHDLQLPNGGTNCYITFENNPCIDMSAYTFDGVSSLKFNLLAKCPPLISQIEQSLKNRDNFITRLTSSVQKMDYRIASLEKTVEALRKQIVKVA